MTIIIIIIIIIVVVIVVTNIVITYYLLLLLSILSISFDSYVVNGPGKADWSYLPVRLTSASDASICNFAKQRAHPEQKQQLLPPFIKSTLLQVGRQRTRMSRGV